MIAGVKRGEMSFLKGGGGRKSWGVESEEGMGRDEGERCYSVVDGFALASWLVVVLFGVMQEKISSM